MPSIEQLRAFKKMMREAMTCRRCGKSIMVSATGWRGHGTGQHGAAHFGATSYEQVSTETHCTCPGGPCDQAGLIPHNTAYDELKAKIDAENNEEPPF